VEKAQNHEVTMTVNDSTYNVWQPIHLDTIDPDLRAFFRSEHFLGNGSLYTVGKCMASNHFDSYTWKPSLHLVSV